MSKWILFKCILRKVKNVNTNVLIPYSNDTSKLMYYCEFYFKR